MTEDVIRARRIELYDEDGNTRALLGAGINGESGLVVWGPGEDAMSIRALISEEAGTPALVLRGSGEDAMIVTVAINPHSGEARLTVGREDDTTVVFIAARADGATRIRMKNANGTEKIIEP